MITEQKFNEICRMYGLVPTKGLEKAFTFPGFENFVWAMYSPTTKKADCWNKEWYLYNIESDSSGARPASRRNDTPSSNIEDFRREMDSMVRNFKVMNKKIRLRKIKEL